MARGVLWATGNTMSVKVVSFAAPKKTGSAGKEGASAGRCDARLLMAHALASALPETLSHALCNAALSAAAIAASYATEFVPGL